MPFWLSAENNGMMLPNAGSEVYTTFRCVAAMNHPEVVGPCHPNMETKLMTMLEIIHIQRVHVDAVDFYRFWLVRPTSNANSSRFTAVGA